MRSAFWFMSPEHGMWYAYHSCRVGVEGGEGAGELAGAPRATVEEWGRGLGCVVLRRERAGAHPLAHIPPLPASHLLTRIGLHTVAYRRNKSRNRPQGVSYDVYKPAQGATPWHGPPPHLDQHGVTQSVGGVPRYLAVVEVRHAAQVAAARALHGGVRYGKRAHTAITGPTGWKVHVRCRESHGRTRAHTVEPCTSVPPCPLKAPCASGATTSAPVTRAPAPTMHR